MSSKEIDPKRVLVHGSGCDQGITGQTCHFQLVGCKGQIDKVFIEIDGPAQPACEKHLDPDLKTINANYTPNLPGEYKVTVKIGDKHIKGSPFKVEILGESDPKYQRVAKVQVDGKGIAIGKAYTDNVFWVDGRAAHLTAGLSIFVKNPERASSQLKINDQNDGTFKCIYKPTAPGQYIINIKVEGIHVPGSPYYVRIT